MGLSPAVVSKRISQLEDRLRRAPVPAHHPPPDADRDGRRLLQARRRHPQPVRGGRGLRQPAQHQAARVAEGDRADGVQPAAHRALHRRLPRPLSRDRARRPYRPTRSSTSSAKASTSPSASASWRIPRSSRAASRPTPASFAPPPPISSNTARPATFADLEHAQLPRRSTPSKCGGWRARRARCRSHPHGNVRSDSGEFIREAGARASASGCCRPGTSAAALESGALRVVLPAYRGSSNMPPSMRSTPAASSCRPKSTS